MITRRDSVSALAGAGFVVAMVAAFVFPIEGTGPQAKDEAGKTISIAYADPGYGWALPTICVGHTQGVFKGQMATAEQCQVFLEEDITKDVLPCLVAQVKVPVTQDQATALGSFVFNVGCRAFKGSTLLRKLNTGDCSGASAEFGRWTKSNGRVLPGLVKRRATEQALFSTGCSLIAQHKESKP